MSYDSIANRADYLSPYYLAEVLPRTIREKGGLRSRWAERDQTDRPGPVKALRALRREYDNAREAITGLTDLERPLRDKTTVEFNGSLLEALGYASEPRDLAVIRSEETYPLRVAYAAQNVLAVDCGWADDADAAFDPEAGGRLLFPVETDGGKSIEAGGKLARWLFDADEPPRYVLLLHGGVIVLADRLAWGEGRYLAVRLNVALERADQGELETIAALFSADVLQPPAEGGEEQLAKFVADSRQKAVGVSDELREGLRESVQIIANEVLDLLREQEAEPETWVDPKELGHKSLKYLYRILFLLYAEARPELGVLPVDDQDYVAGYSMARLGELVSRRLGGDAARQSHHLYESLDVLFRMVNNGHRPRGSAVVADDASETDGLRFEALKADLFLPYEPPSEKNGWRAQGEPPLIGPEVRHPARDDVTFDIRLRDGALHAVLHRLMLTKGRGRGAGRRGKTERGGFISYSQLGISQLGAVYEGLMSYTGFIAPEELYEVAKKGDPSAGSWMIPATKVPDYPDDVFVMVKDDSGFKTRERVRYKAGAFVYRLAGRDRQTSASYYTPHSLTSVTVQLALQQREKEEGRPVTADDVLRWRVCEPALGSGAFLNEAINQLAALYLRKREEGEGKLEPDERALELQRVKTHIALHNCYGVDLNQTAVELAEVSIWLNVMHRGLQDPWFGLHLVRGNSLIGAGRRLYAPKSLREGAWLDSAPVDHPFSAGKLPDGHIHHFLLPAKGWGAVAAEKEAKQLSPDGCKRLADWRKKVRRSPSDKKAGRKLSQVERLQALSSRAEFLWFLVAERLTISEREISRPIEVWGAENLPSAREGMDRDQILADLTSPGTPYWRLKTLMDAWCALWFWPVGKADLLDGSADVYESRFPAPVPAKVEPAPRDPDPNFPTKWEKDDLFGGPAEPVKVKAAREKAPKADTDRRVIPLANLDDWLDFAEALLGRTDVDDGSFARSYEGLESLGQYEDELEEPDQMYMDPVNRLLERFPWLQEVHNVADQQGFFHWELRFAGVFADGGFDIQVGNPPWVRPTWEENPVLAELDPWFELQEKPSVPVHNARKAELLASSTARSFYLAELTDQVGKESFIGNVATYDLLVGTQPDLYRAMMIRTWRNTGSSGIVGLLHPDTHLAGNREKLLRAATYPRLRIHGDFVNSGNRFFPPPVNRSSHFGMHIYGRPQQIEFAHLGWLLDAEELPKSLALAEAGELPSTWNAGSGVPGVKHGGNWDERPHPDRVVWVDSNLLSIWRLISGDEDQAIGQTKLLNPVTVKEQDAIAALAKVPLRLGQGNPRISPGYHEAGAKKEGLIRWDTHDPADWSEAILKGPQIGVATPFFKQPPETGTKGRPQDLTVLPDDALPRSEYARATSIEEYQREQDRWIDHRELKRLRDSPEALINARSELAAMQDIDPDEIEPAHVDGYLTDQARRPYTDFYRLAWRRMIPDDTDRSLFSAIYPPGPAHVDAVHSLAMLSNRETVLVSGFWAGLPTDYLLRITGRTDLRVSDVRQMPAPQTDHPLAAPLLLRTLRLNCLTTAYADLWAELYDDAWRDEQWVAEWPGIAPLGDIGPEWVRGTPLRTEYERRAALVEIDALVAAWLGITEEQLEAIYPARYPVLGDYEDVTWFDATGRKIAGNWNTFGTGQTKEHWAQFQAYEESGGTTPPPEGYTPPFYKANRVGEYRQAHAAFTERLKRG